jgi:hypothetical protein
MARFDEAPGRPGPRRATAPARAAAAEQWAWIAGAAALGGAVSAIFSSWLHLARGPFLVPYLLAVAALLEAYRRRFRVEVRAALRARRVAGLLGAVASGAFVVWSVLRQPSTPVPDHAALQVLWLGVAYGTADGLLLSVLPVGATWRALTAPGSGTPRGGWLGAGVLGLGASLVVTAAYHLGYEEYRGAGLGGPLVGCGVMSLAYVLTRNPLAAVLSHVAMHVAAVLHGIDSTVQLPPHG